MSEVYIVNKPFKYMGEQLQVGDVWEPAGGKWDDQIIASALGLNAFGHGKLVRIEEQEDESENGWSALTHRQLKEECKKRGLPVYGKKDDLIRRLEDA